MDSLPSDSVDSSPPGYVCAEATDLFLKDLIKGQAFTKGPYTDKWGTWISGLAPIKDVKTNRIIAFIGMDMDANFFWFNEVAHYRLTMICITLILCFLTVYWKTFIFLLLCLMSMVKSCFVMIFSWSWLGERAKN